MKSTYKAPQMMQVEIRTKYLVSTSTTEQDVYTDNPQPPSNALTKESHNVWDNEW